MFSCLAYKLDPWSFPAISWLWGEYGQSSLALDYFISQMCAYKYDLNSNDVIQNQIV